MPLARLGNQPAKFINIIININFGQAFLYDEG